MIVEQRIYTTLPGKWREYLALYEKEALPIQMRILGRMVGYYTTDIGGLNQIVHMWAYKDLVERDEKRAQMSADEGFQAYLKKMFPLLQSQESKILKPTPFFTPSWQEVQQ